MLATTTVGSSVPAMGLRVKNVIVDALTGHAVRVHEIGMSVSSESSDEEVFAAISAVRDVEAQTRLRSCFCQGDAYSQARRRSGNEIQFAKAFKRKFGSKVFNDVRRCGWVAEKWPIGKRRADKSWNWHIKTPPDGPAKPDKQRPDIPLKVVETLEVEGVWEVRLVDDYGRRYVGKVEAE